MYWLRIIGGVLLLLLGIVWIGQGLDLIKGSGMSGHGQWGVAGVVVALFGVWLLSGVVRMRPSQTSRR
jgi:hypothetical protein